MKIAKYYICKKTAYHLDGSRSFELGQKYRFISSMGNVVYLDLNGAIQPLTKEYFKEHFKQKAIN